MHRQRSVLFAGTFDPEFGRNKQLKTLLECAGYDVVECRVELWGADRYEIPDRRKLRIAARALVAYPRLVLQFLRVQRCDAVLVCYPGWFDVIALAPFATLRRMPIVFDPFISLYDTVVSDRQLAEEKSIIGRLSRWIDKVSMRVPKLVLADTVGHADFFAELAGRDRSDIEVVPLGADDAVFKAADGEARSSDLVLFYGNFIPLHGVPTIVRAAKELEADRVPFRIIGAGQEFAKVRELVEELRASNVELVDRVPLEELPREIAAASICLGIFGTSVKVRRVVPHKVYECTAVGRPVVTADTPAIRSAFNSDEIVVVPAGDPEALAEALRALLADERRRRALAAAGRARYRASYSQEALVQRVRDAISRVARS